MVVLSGVALGAPVAEDAGEEIVVYADDFARWDHTRWWVQAELALPTELRLEADQNLALTTHALQVRAVIGCEKVGKLSAHRWEVSCAIEDLGLRVTTATDWGTEARRQRVQRVLDEVDGRLTGAAVQLQVTADGGVTNLDLEGVAADNLRERASQESLRSLLSLVMAGFHLRIPDHAQRDGEWTERHAELLDLPSPTGTRGSNLVVHRASDLRGDRLVHTVGEGRIAIAVAVAGDDVFAQSKLVQLDGTDTMAKPVGGGAGVALRFPPPPDQPPTEANLGTTSTAGAVPQLPPAGDVVDTYLQSVWATSLSAAAVFERETGILTERSWVATGRVVSTGEAGVGPYLNAGSLWRLGPDDRPDVGPTTQVAWPGHAMADLPPWIPL